MWQSDALSLDVDDSGVATLRIDRPPVNALNRALQEALAQAAAVIDDTERIRVVVLTGGDSVFAAGADVREMAAWDADTARAQVGPMHAAFDAVAGIRVPVIAAIAGFALGGGCELAMCADLRIAADTATLGQPEIALGIIPGAGGTARLARLVGPSRAKDLILTGRRVDAAEALALGLVDRVVPAADLHAQAYVLAASLAHGPAGALAAAKRAIDAGTAVAAGLAAEREEFAALFGTPDQQEGFAAFLSKRRPDFG